MSSPTPIRPILHVLIGLIAALGLTLVAPQPAHALSVSLNVSRTSAGPSTPVTFTGTAVGAVTGWPVTLQRRLGSGTWSTVKTGDSVSSSDTYSLTSYVAVGTYSYRTKVGSAAWSPPVTVTGVYGRNIAVPAAGAPFTLNARLPHAKARKVLAQVSSNGSTWTTLGQGTSSSSGGVGVRMYLKSTSYVRMVAPASGSLPAWAGPRGGVAVGTDPVIKRILDDTNAYRVSRGKPALHIYWPLNKVAGNWAYYMHQTCTFKHNPNFGAQYPSGWQRAGENIAAGQRYENVVRNWTDSPPHRANILGDYTHIGIGYYEGSKCYKRYWVQNLAKY